MLAAIIAVCIIIADQVSKYFVVQHMELHEVKGFIPNIMSFEHTRNTGAAFSMLSDQRWVYMILSIAAMALIVYILYREYSRHTFLNISLAMVLGGGIGNMIDRIRLEYVVDFFRFDFVDFAIFNVADIFITCGAACLTIYVIFIDPKVEKRIKAEQAALEAANNQDSQSEESAENTPAEDSVSEESAENPSENEGNNG